MAAAWAGYVLKIGDWLARRAFERVRLERARRGAEEGFPHKFQLLAPFLDEAIDLLVGGRPSPFKSPWMWIKYKASSPPEVLQTPSAREWLSTYDVREATKKAIQHRLSGELSEEAEGLLIESWSAQTGESANEAKNVAESLLAFVALSIERHLSVSERIVLAHQQASKERILQRIASPEFLVEAGSNAWIDREVLSQLARALQRRQLPACDVAAELATIVDAFDSGELRQSSPQTRAIVFSWLARA